MLVVCSLRVPRPRRKPSNDEQTTGSVTCLRLTCGVCVKRKNLTNCLVSHIFDKRKCSFGKVLFTYERSCIPDRIRVFHLVRREKRWFHRSVCSLTKTLFIISTTPATNKKCDNDCNDNHNKNALILLLLIRHFFKAVLIIKLIL